MWDKLKEQLNIMKIEKKRLYLISNSDKFDSKEDFLDAIASALQGGVEIIQLDEQLIPDKIVVELAHKIRILCDEFGATLVINNRADIAQLCQADGIHLEQNSITIDNARELLGKNSIIGMSISNTQEAVDAFNDGADYLLMETDLATLKDIDSQQSEDFYWICQNVEIPLFIKAEVTKDNINAYIQAGVQRIAVENSLMYSKIPEETARKLLKFLP